MLNVIIRTSFEVMPGEWFVAGSDWDTDTKTVVPYTATAFEEEQFELAPGALIDEYCIIGQPIRREVRYQDSDPAAVPSEWGGVYYRDQNDPVACPVGCGLFFNPPRPVVTWNGTVATVRLSAFSTVGPLTALFGTRLLPPIPGDAGTFEVSPVAPGRYRFVVEDQGTGCRLTSEEVVVGSGPPITGPQAEPAIWLKYIVTEDPVIGEQNQVIFTVYHAVGTAYDAATRTVVPVTIELPPPGRGDYSRPTTELIDSYFLPDGRTFRRVYHDGNGDVRLSDIVPAAEAVLGELRLLNLIKTDIDAAGTATGRVWLEGDSPALPITYTLNGESNTTGQFAGLSAQAHEATLRDAQNRTLTVPFTIEDRYRLRWRLDIDDAQATPLRVDILERDFAGAPVSVCGSGSPVQRGWDGNPGPGGEIPAALGQVLDLELVASSPRQFADLSLQDDRRHRVDVYRGEGAGTLVFRGYVSPDTYSESLLGGLQYIKVTASCGLGPLGDIDFATHEGLPMRGRRPLLATILHCLSRTDTNLPVQPPTCARS